MSSDLQDATGGLKDSMAEGDSQPRALDAAKVIYRPFGRSKLGQQNHSHTYQAVQDEIPNELLVIILQFLYFSAERAAPDERAQIPGQLSSVSQRWRAVAMVVPELWTFVFIRSADLPGVEEAVAHFRERSDPLLMHFDITAGTKTDEVLAADFILRENIGRIRRLTFRTFNFIPTCLTSNTPVWPVLTEVDLVSRHSKDVRLGLLAPQLKKLYCNGVVPMIPTGDMQSLQDLTLCDLNVLRITRPSLIMARWSNLQRLHLRRWTLEPEYPGYEIPLRHMPCLTYLKFERMGLDALRGVLAMIFAPKLETLIVEEVEDPLGGWLDPSWATVSLRPLEGLTYLRLHNFWKIDGPCTLASILKVAPNLTHLVISNRELVALIGIDDDPERRLGAALQVLEIDAEFWPWEDVEKFINTRAETLKTVCVPEHSIRIVEGFLGTGGIQVRALKEGTNWKTSQSRRRTPTY